MIRGSRLRLESNAKEIVADPMMEKKSNFRIIVELLSFLLVSFALLFCLLAVRSVAMFAGYYRP